MLVIVVSLPQPHNYIVVASVLAATHQDAVRFGDMKYALGLALFLAVIRRVTRIPFSILGDMVVARKVSAHLESLLFHCLSNQVV